MATTKSTTTARKSKSTAKTSATAKVSEIDEKLSTVKQNVIDSKKAVTDEQSEIEMLKAQIAELQKAIANASANATSTATTVAGTVPKVQFLWQAEVADENVITFGDHGEYGRVVGKTGTFFCPKDELSRILTTRNTYFLKKRWLIVLSGLDEDERVSLGVDYKEGELLDRKAFAKMIDLGEEMLNIYPNLCEGHKAMVAQRYAEAYDKGNKNITRDLITKLNQLSKDSGSAKGDFVSIIEKMNAKEAQ